MAEGRGRLSRTAPRQLWLLAAAGTAHPELCSDGAFGAAPLTGCRASSGRVLLKRIGVSRITQALGGVPQSAEGELLTFTEGLLPDLHRLGSPSCGELEALLLISGGLEGLGPSPADSGGRKFQRTKGFPDIR